MSSGFIGQAKELPIRVARSIAARTGNESRMEELEAVFNDGRRRALRDDLATKAILASVLRFDSSAIVVGASAGDVLEEITRLAPDGRHIAYEPTAHLYADLVERFPDVDVRAATLGEEAGESVEVQRLDDALPRRFKPALIGIDVAGAEVLVLRGARRTLARHRPVLLIEHDSKGADLHGTTSGELWDIVDDCGMRIFDLEGSGPLPRDLFNGPNTQQAGNYLVVPK